MNAQRIFEEESYVIAVLPQMTLFCKVKSISNAGALLEVIKGKNLVNRDAKLSSMLIFSKAEDEMPLKGQIIRFYEEPAKQRKFLGVKFLD